MKDQINLLPPAVIRTREQRIYLERLGQVQRFVVVGLLLLLLSLAGAYGVVWYVDGFFAEQFGNGESSQSEFVSEVQTVNERIIATRDWQESHAAWTPRLPDIFDALSSGIFISQMVLDEESGALTVKGVFSSREDLVAFQRRLEGFSWVREVDAPLSNFEVGQQTEFTVTIHRVL